MKEFFKSMSKVEWYLFYITPLIFFSCSEKNNVLDSVVRIEDSSLKDVRTGGGNDSIIIAHKNPHNLSVNANSSYYVDGVNVNRNDIREINTGGGDDTLTITRYSLTNYTINTGDGDDVIMLIGSGLGKSWRTDFFHPRANKGWFNTGKGDDSITMVNTHVSYGMDTGEGDDYIYIKRGGSRYLSF